MEAVPYNDDPDGSLFFNVDLGMTSSVRQDDLRGYTWWPLKVHMGMNHGDQSFISNWRNSSTFPQIYVKSVNIGWLLYSPKIDIFQMSHFVQYTVKESFIMAQKARHYFFPKDMSWGWSKKKWFTTIMWCCFIIYFFSIPTPIDPVTFQTSSPQRI